ncbi:MAG: glycosyl hydrolase [Ruminococcaceae bacterium]|nr:glycosyl hydrolase [Oscillospiraceae bacterium]
MTLKEKIAFCTGKDGWHTKAIKRCGLSSIKMSDGPHGLRCQPDHASMLGINHALPATCFPPAVTAGATWNRALFAREGFAIGKEAGEAGVSVVLGPGCNIKRNPLGGRNFEYLSEDPYLAGQMAAAFIQGQQQSGVASCVKHFAVNNQEYKRMNGDSQVDERTLRELYLPPFETAVKKGKVETVMCSYNKINGVHASDNKKLLTYILRDEWGFDGTVITDWGALHDRIAAFEAGCDLNMPGGSRYMERATVKAVKSGALSESAIDSSVVRILRLAQKRQSKKRKHFDREAHHQLALQIALQGAVLLKNEGVLPLVEKDTVLIGYMAKELRYQGSGSSHINPTKLVSIEKAMPQALCLACGDGQGTVSQAELAMAAEAASKKKTAVVVVGLPDSYESEGFDRSHMRLPQDHCRLVETVAAINPNTVVVLLGGSVVELPFADRVKAILYMGLPGQAGGQAAAELLTGKESPSGKLTESWPLCYEDVISKETFGQKNTEYREGIYVGYRYYDKAEKEVRYPFGHGLSYTAFAYSDLSVEGHRVRVTITNTGAVRGAEVVQLYIAPPQQGVFRPKRELKGFERVELAPGESKTLTFFLNRRSFAIWQEGWRVPAGAYTVEVGASSRDIRLRQRIDLSGESIDAPAWQAASFYQTAKGTPSRADWECLMGHKVPLTPEPQKGQYGMDSTCMEMRADAPVIEWLSKTAEAVISIALGGKKNPNDPTYRMVLTGAMDCPMRAMVINTGGKLGEPLAKLLLRLANGSGAKASNRQKKQYNVLFLHDDGTQQTIEDFLLYCE